MVPAGVEHCGFQVSRRLLSTFRVNIESHFLWENLHCLTCHFLIGNLHEIRIRHLKNLNHALHIDNPYCSQSDELVILIKQYGLCHLS